MKNKNKRYRIYKEVFFFETEIKLTKGTVIHPKLDEYDYFWRFEVGL